MNASIADFIENIPSLSFQQKRMLTEHAQDLLLWGGPTIQDLWPKHNEHSSTNIKQQTKNDFNTFLEKVGEIRRMPIDYDSFNPQYDFSGKKPVIVPDFKSPETIMGKCPCPRDGEQTRCCNLKTLDAVQQCAFACAYCSIQSFYSKGEIKVVSDLKQHLENMVLEDDAWHIGTGQSSDSLLLGDDYGTLTALASFAKLHPQTVIELKTKCARTDWTSMDLPRNIVATWSVNAPTIVKKEEHLAASVESRIMAARKAQEKGILVGFHIHPMVHFKGWKDEYAYVVRQICDNIDPDNAVMVGIGTLTFTKQNLKTLRESERPTRVTQMELTPIAGKFSYPLDVKREMFSYVHSLFPKEWKEKVFFYLCMEDPSLWEPCLGRSYKCNADFEEDMKNSYYRKLFLK